MKEEFKICTVIQGKTLGTFVRKLEKGQASGDMVELRADSVNDFNIDDIPIIKGPVKLPSIFTLRHVKEGGLYEGSRSLQREILKKAFDFDFTYIDVSYNNPVLNDLSSKEKKRLLLS